MSMFCQIMDKSESGGCGCKIPSSVLSKILSETSAASTVSDGEVTYERILAGIAQALNLPLNASAARFEEHAL